MNKVRKIVLGSVGFILFCFFFFSFGIKSFCLPLSLLQKIKNKITIVIKAYITLEQKERLWTRDLQELFTKKKCYPGKSTLNTFEIFRATLRLVNT